jgi:hypothetical protein
MKSAVNFFALLLLWLFTLLAFKVIETGFIPDILKLADLSEEDTKGYFKFICEVTASVFAILMAVFTVGYELLGNTARRRKRFKRLNNILFIAYASMAVAIILFSFYASFSFLHLKNSSNLTLAYFVGILFCFFLIFLFPTTLWLLNLSNTVYKTKRLIKSNPKDQSYPEEIIDELNYYINEGDSSAYGDEILPCLTEHTLKFLGDANNRNEANVLLRELVRVWSACNEDAFKSGETRYFSVIWHQVQRVYAHAVSHNSLLLHFQELECFIRDQMYFLESSKNQDGLINAATTLAEIYINQLKYNCPHQETIDDLYWQDGLEAPFSSMVAGSQWKYINEILQLLFRLQEKAIHLKSKALFDKVAYEYGNILFDLRYNPNVTLGNLQVNYIVAEGYSYAIHFAKNALDARMYKYACEALNFNFHELSEFIKEEKGLSPSVMQDIHEYIIFSQKNGYLEDYTTINRLGMFGRSIIRFYPTNHVAQNVLLLVVEILGELSIEIHKTNNFNENKNYSEIKTVLESFKAGLQRNVKDANRTAAFNKIESIISTY